MFLRPFTSELEKKAKKELKEAPWRRETDLKHLREWIAKQPHLKARTDTTWLLNFLRSSKFSQQRTKEKLDFFYTMKSLLPEFYKNRDPLLPEIQEVLTRGIFLPLDSPDVDVIIIRWHNADPNIVSFVNVVKVGLMIFDMLLNESKTCIIVGQQIIDDFQNFPLSYMKEASPMLLKNLSSDILRGYPVRIKGFHLINSLATIETVFNMVKPLLNKKFQNRIKIHREGKMQELYEDVPLSILPKEYGGEGDSVDEIAAKWKKRLESYRDWFLEDEQYGVDETKRPEKMKVDFDDIFGLDGSFRHLEID